MDPAGLVALAVAGLWIAYLVPHRLRYRQQLLESRTDDRFSEHLRVVRVADGARPATTVRPSAARPGRVLLHPTARRAGRGAALMDRPHAAGDRVTADAARRSAAQHAARAAHLARRSAGARRRALLSALLLVVSVAAWAGVAVSGLALGLGATPTVLLVGVLGLGRRAVRAGARADAEWAAGAATRLPLAPSHRTPAAVGRAVHPSDAITEVMARVPARGAATVERHPVSETTAAAQARIAEASAARATDRGPSTGATTATRQATSTRAEVAHEVHAPVEEAGTWAPVPVPRPSYTLKPSARRGEPVPLLLDEATPSVVAERAAHAADEAQAAAEAAGGAAQAAQDASGRDERRPTTGGLELDAILARRRASGE